MSSLKAKYLLEKKNGSVPSLIQHMASVNAVCPPV